MLNNDRVFSVERVGDVIVIEPLGDETTYRYFDIHNESNRVMRQLDDTDIRGVVIDLRGVPSLGWVMTSAIVRLVRNVDYRGGLSVFCSGSETNRIQFASMRLGHPWTDHSSRAEAVAALDEQPDREGGERASRSDEV